jgi:hypothetical protein
LAVAAVILSSTGASRGFGAAAAGLRHEEETEGAPAKRGIQARQEQRPLRCHSAPAQLGLPRTSSMFFFFFYAYNSHLLSTHLFILIIVIIHNLN